VPGPPDEKDLYEKGGLNLDALSEESMVNVEPGSRNPSGWPFWRQQLSQLSSVNSRPM